MKDIAIPSRAFIVLFCHMYLMPVKGHNTCNKTRNKLNCYNYYTEHAKEF